MHFAHSVIASPATSKEYSLGLRKIARKVYPPFLEEMESEFERARAVHGVAFAKVRVDHKQNAVDYAEVLRSLAPPLSNAVD